MIDIQKLKSGDRRTLAKAITLIESTKEEDQKQAEQLLNALSSEKTKSFRLGISGSPGVGKSTFIENFGQFLIGKKHKVAVLAIDPSSPTSGGSILGDKTRMEKLATMDEAFIRPSPTSGTLGGVAQRTREVILLCEAAGFDFIIVETVGVGQSEYEVAKMVDFFLLLILPSGGDELQGIKKGILEVADSIIINKADGDNLNLAKQTQAQYQSALQIVSHSPFWKTEVTTHSSHTTGDADKVYDLLLKYKNIATQNQYWDEKRENQNKEWFETLLKEALLKKVYENADLKALYLESKNKLHKKEITAMSAVQQIVKSYFRKS